MSLVEPTELKHLAFPTCFLECSFAHTNPSMACETQCPFKFRKCTNKPYLYEHLSQRELDAHHSQSEKPQ